MFSTGCRLLVGAGLLALGAMAFAGEPAGQTQAEDPMEPATQSVNPADERAMWNLPSPTLGGRQFWADQLHFRGWRIQTNVFTGHSRLLDPDDHRRAWGTYDHCRSTLDGIRKVRSLKPLTGRAVVLIHGIIRSSHSFDAMKAAFVADGYEVIGFDYPSTQVSIEESAEYLHQTLESLEGIERIDFVVHSMGGLLARQYLRKHRDPRISRMVMLGVPNHGANLANLLRNVTLFKTIYGPAGQQLCEGPDAYVTCLPTPDFSFAVIAGGKGTAAGFNPWIAGDDDGTVAVESTRLAGAADFIRLPVLHTFMMRDPAVISATRRFLNGATLSESGIACPIEKTRADENTADSGSLNSGNSAAAKNDGDSVKARPIDSAAATPKD